MSLSEGSTATFTSGGATYVEALVDGMWRGQDWAVGHSRSGTGDAWTEAAFELTTSHGVASGDWRWMGTHQAPPERPGQRHVVVDLESAAVPIRVAVHTVSDSTPIFTRWLEVTNCADELLSISTLAPWAGRLWSGGGPFRLGYATEWRVQCEGWFGWTPLEPGVKVIENDHGLVWCEPYFVLHDESRGEYFFGQLAWPVNYRMEFHVDDGLCFRVGPSAHDELRVLDPGEVVTTPAVHLGGVKGDFDDAVQAMHDHMRRSVLPPRDLERAFRVQYLLPEDQPLTVYHREDYNEANLSKCIDVVADVGGELLIVDGPTWAEGFGNWTPKEEWFPRGLGPVREHAHEKGVLFGVYAEPEGGRGDWTGTAAFTEHPEWFVQRNPDWPGHNFLNLAIPEAAAYMESEWRRIAKDIEIDIYRHDQNGCFGEQGSSTQRGPFVENDYWRHYDAFYAMAARMRERFPGMILQQASGGGTRLELATLAAWDEHYTSDRVSRPYVYQMSSGVSVHLPPEVLVTPFGMAGTHGPTDRPTLLRCIYALGNTPMIFNGVLPGSVEELDDETRQEFRRYADLYKSFMRPLLPATRIYHHAPVNATGGVESGPWFAMEFAAPDRSKAWAVIIWMTDDEPKEYLYRPRGLCRDIEYEVTLDNADAQKRMPGSVLASEGLRVRPDAACRSELLLFVAR